MSDIGMTAKQPDNPRIKVSHVGDFSQVVPDGMLLVESDHGYAKVCQQLIDHADASDGAEVWVRQESHFRWLTSFVDQTGIAASFERQTPRRLLAARWDVSVPAWLEDQAVLAQDLLGMVPPKHKADNFQQALLVTCLGAPVGSKVLNEENLTAVLASLTDANAKQQFTKYPCLRQCLDDVCTGWADSSHDHWGRDVCKGLAGDANNLWRELTLWAILAGYPAKLLEFAVQPEKIAFLQSLPVETLADMQLHAVGTEQAWSQVEIFLKDVKPEIKDDASFLKLGTSASGRLPREFRELSSILRSDQFAPTPECIEIVKRTFRSCPGVSSTALSALDRLVQPTFSSALPDGSFRDAKAWIDWAVNEYFPYRRWQTLNQRYSQELEKDVQWFSDWYTNEYASVHHDGGLSLVHTLTQWRDAVVGDDLSIIIMVDCLPVAFWQILESAFTGVGFHRHSIDYRFAPLPTDTEHCKARVIEGGWEQNAKQYGSLLKGRIAADWPGKTGFYVPDLKSLGELGDLQTDTVILLNLLRSDEILHAEVESSGTTHEEELHRLFVRLADEVSSLTAAWAGQSDKVGIYVLTDHGAAMVLPEEIASLESQTIENLFDDDRYRFATVTASQADEIPENLWQLGYRFQEPFAAKDAVFFIPRGHNTVRSRRSTSSYMHGGASPEEVIVPTAAFRVIARAWPEPLWRFTGLSLSADNAAAFYVCRTVRLNLEIQNQAHEPLNVLTSEVVCPPTDMEGASTPTIPAMGTGTVTYDCYFAKKAQSEDMLLIQLIYEIGGEERTLDIRLPAVFRSAQTGGFSLKDLP